MTMTEDKQAARLALWVREALERSGAPPEPPQELDDDVREAIAGLRPDLLPAPRVTAEDLLGSIGAGPLAEPPQVIPFPMSVPVARSAARRGWRAVGGAGGIGLLIAAAGVLYVSGVDEGALDEPARAPVVEQAAGEKKLDAPAAPDDAAVPPALEPSPLPPVVAARPARGSAPLPVTKTGEFASDGKIAESEPRAARALPSSELPAAPAAAAPLGGLAELDSVASDLDGVTRERFDRARSEAESLAASGRYAEAAATLTPVVTAPAPAGMFHAALAADYWLLAGDADAAVTITLQGLSLSSEATPERTALLVRLERAQAAQSKVNRSERIDEKR